MDPSYPQQPAVQPQQAPQRTPFWHCAVAAGIWYVAMIARFGSEVLSQRALEMAITGAIGWLLTTTLMWGCSAGRGSRSRRGCW